ncbi:hypothetical protein EDD18DRAFT_153117 [Armillaria luteobubalina]|uniref:Secreted protein n=1 Tax=Armillaria luteobubalina TaxID=153913 RepID=A0AA39UXS1_9AGAR|nr:hypothetical protein EDD18DRAFT_153117 [Armillaria luteobubalina]
MSINTFVNGLLFFALVDAGSRAVLLFHAASVSRLEKLPDMSELSWQAWTFSRCLLLQCERMPVTQKGHLHTGTIWLYCSSSWGDISSKRVAVLAHDKQRTRVYRLQSRGRPGTAGLQA